MIRIIHTLDIASKSSSEIKQISTQMKVSLKIAYLNLLMKHHSKPFYFPSDTMQIFLMFHACDMPVTNTYLIEGWQGAEKGFGGNLYILYGRNQTV